MNLSIVIPLLNEQESLPELHQWIVKVMTTHNYSYEVIFIDDGSTDGSAHICDELAAHDSRVHVFHQKNQGVTAARRNGLQHAKGNYIFGVDADDYVGENWLKMVFHL